MRGKTFFKKFLEIPKNLFSKRFFGGAWGSAPTPSLYHQKGCRAMRGSPFFS
jgi:hypothetical protein